MRVFERVIESFGAPGKHDLWVKRVDGGYSILINENDKWVPVSGSGGGTTVRMVVYGKFAEGESDIKEFVPNDGQPTFSEAVEAFESGIPVTLVIDVNENSRISASILGHIINNGTAALVPFPFAGNILWRNGESSEPHIS